MKLIADLISSWIENNSSVLDLGCGDGHLLKELKTTKHISDLGVEINTEKITQAISNGINVIEHNLDKGLQNIDDQSFDTVIMTQTLQAVKYPNLVLQEMLRVGKKGIVSFPNFGHWRSRWHLNFHGRMPVSEVLPYEWYNTPNIHLCTIRDFEELCEEENIAVIDRIVVNDKLETNKLLQRHPNFLGSTAIYLISKK